MTSTGDARPVVLAQRYRLEERVGAGSMGAVWRASDDLLGRTVAVKQLLLQPGAPGFVDTRGAGYDEARQRILREGRLAARLQHPHAIAVFDVVLHDDAPWLVMEYLPSRTLGKVVDTEGTLDPVVAADIGRQIADGLAAAHAAGIVHRDIKPGNVLIGSDGVVKITDFGVSRATDDVQLTRTGLIAGTPAYLAPEVARGETPTAASDVFALGATLYAAVEGEPPFGLDENAYALLYKVGAGSIRPPERAGPLTDALLHMLRSDPAERPSARGARDELGLLAGAREDTELYAGRSAEQRRTGATGTRVDLASVPQPAPGGTPAPAVPSAGRGRLPVDAGRGGAPIDAGTDPGVSAPQPPRGSGAGPGSAPDPAGPSGVPVPRVRPPGPGTRRPGGPARPPAAEGSGGRHRRWSRRTWAVAALVVLLLAAGFTAYRSGALGTLAPGSTSSAAGPNRPVITDPSASDLEDFVRDYYGLLPDQPAEAWSMLGTQARAASDGFASYRRFYGSISAVSFATDPTAVDGKTVRASLRFVPKSGSVSVERYQFTVVPGADGKLVMTAFTRDAR